MDEGYPGSGKAVYRALQSARACFYAWLFRVSRERRVIEMDIERWTGILAGTCPPGAQPENGLVRLVVRYPEFRTLFCYRAAKDRRFGARILLELARFCYRPLESLYIVTPSIGPGLFIQHGFSTIIAARSIGSNCWVNQQVTIGFSSVDDCPTLGDNVSVKAGAIVIGDIAIGDGAIVGAGAVVVKDVPPGVTVGGVPARVIGRAPERTGGPPDAT